MLVRLAETGPGEPAASMWQPSGTCQHEVPIIGRPRPNAVKAVRGCLVSRRLYPLCLLSLVRLRSWLVAPALKLRRAVTPSDLTNGICGLDYHFQRYRIPLAFDGNPILTLPHVVASAVTISVRATHDPLGGSHILKPLAYCRRNVVELPPIHCGGSSHANCTEHERSEEWSSFAVSQRRS